jgi:glycosyltransferase involved in cell wall biosynthesis
MSYPKDKIGILAGAVDHGTSSISASFVTSLEVSDSRQLSQGVREGGILPLLSAILRMYKWEARGCHTLCLFNTPALIGGLLPNLFRRKRVAILDWTWDCPEVEGRKKKYLYDAIYRLAFRALYKVASPSTQFISFYSSKKKRVVSVKYPMPLPDLSVPKCENSGQTRILFIGADFKRKGGDILLSLWKEVRPQKCSLTFVCPIPPVEKVDGVTFQKEINSGTSEHKKLFFDHDILLLPSKLEPFGYVLLEAISFGLVPVTTSCVGAASIVLDAGGYVEESPEEAILKCFSLAQERESLSQSIERISSYKLKYKNEFLSSISSLFHEE